MKFAPCSLGVGISGRVLRGFPAMSLNDPRSVLLDGVVHGIRGQVKIAGPTDGAQTQSDLPKEFFVAQAGENTSRLRLDKGCHIDVSGAPVIETHAQAKA